MNNKIQQCWIKIEDSHPRTTFKYKSDAIVARPASLKLSTGIDKRAS
jgi:hypothetical protein